MPAVALSIGGSDPSGGAGIQADLKVFHQFGVYGEAVISLLTVQNTRAVSRVHFVDAALLREQIEAVVADIPPAAAKTGALGNREAVEAVAEMAGSWEFPLIVDPVMISKHGARLLSEDAQASFKRKLLPRAFLLTPNIPEAESLTGMTIRNEDGMHRAAQQLRNDGCRAVLLKGGHLIGEPVDIYSGPEAPIARFPGQRVRTRNTHGTGCTYSAAITAALALGMSTLDAIAQSKRFVQSAIETAPELGAGCGPLNHWSKDN